MRMQPFVWFAQVLVLSFGFALDGNAGIIVIPSPGVSTTTSAQYATDFDTNRAGPEANSNDFFSDQAVALGTAGLPGGVQSYSKAGGAGGVGPVAASSSVIQTTNWIGAGADTPIDLDVVLDIDGFLRTADFAGSNPGNLSASVTFMVDVVTQTARTQIFSAVASLQNGFGLSTIGNWLPGDFLCGGSNDQTCTLLFGTTIEDSIFVAAGELFAVEVALSTSANVVGAFETITLADFFNTGSFDLSTSTPGASFTFVPEANGVWLLLSAIGGIVLMRRGH